MIKGISKIKGLGVYGDYTKPAGINEFGVKNLIYGWNYSGKTTLSRLFAQLENKTLNPDISGSTFTIDTDEEPITEKNFTQSYQTVRVFNSDFVRDNLNFAGQSFKPILLLGKESEEAQRKLDHCEELYKRTQEKVREITRETGEIESESSTAKTATASKIKKTLGLVEAYTATHLGRDISTISTLEGSQLQADEQLRGDLKLSLTPESEKPITVPNIAVSPSIESLHGEAEALLALTPNLASTIKHLEENPLIEGWVEKGLTLHSENDRCEFCGGDLSKHRLADLQAHFSKDLADHKRNVEELHNRIKAAKMSITMPKEAEFNPHFRDKFRETISPLSEAIEAFNMTVDTLMADVQKKIGNPFKVHEPTALPEDIGQAVIDNVNAVNQVIDDNNQVASNFTKAKQDAIKRAKFHLVQEFVDEQVKSGRDAKVEWLKIKKGRLNRFAEMIEKESDKLKAIISHAQLGREDINKRLASMLGEEAVQINVVPEGGQERFQLVRKNWQPAKNLSDGEKTAIAFSYFLTKLKELKPEEFKETIVYIDDPISSLDANHIFQVTAAIREFFFHQVQSNGNLEWTTRS